jgi:uncharacterized membrane protein (TIGR02234 family)
MTEVGASGEMGGSARAPRRSRGKLLVLLAIALASVAVLAGATQTWVTLSLVEGAAASSTLEASGQQLNASLSPLAIAALAAALALTIAGPWLRRLLGVLILLLGAGVAAIADAAMRDPWDVASARLAEVTGLAGAAQAGVVASGSTSPIIVLVLIAGVVLAALGLLVLVLGGRWKAAGRKYESTPSGAAVGTAADGPRDRISDWDELSGGLDPTSAGEEDGDEPGGDSPESATTR